MQRIESWRPSCPRRNRAVRGTRVDGATPSQFPRREEAVTLTLVANDLPVAAAELAGKHQGEPSHERIPALLDEEARELPAHQNASSLRVVEMVDSDGPPFPDPLLDRFRHDQEGMVVPSSGAGTPACHPSKARSPNQEGPTQPRRHSNRGCATIERLMPPVRSCEFEHPKRILDLIGTSIETLVIDEPERYRPLIAEVLVITPPHIHSLEAFNREAEAVDFVVGRGSRNDGRFPLPQEVRPRRTVVSSEEVTRAESSVAIVDDSVRGCLGRVVTSVTALVEGYPREVEEGWLARFDLALTGSEGASTLCIGIWRRDRCYSPMIRLAADEETGGRLGEEFLDS